jgi:hypothetical protein
MRLGGGTGRRWELAVVVEERVGGEAIGEGAGAERERVEGGAEGAEAEHGAALERGREGGRDGGAWRRGGRCAHLEEEGDGVEVVPLRRRRADPVRP